MNTQAEIKLNQIARKIWGEMKKIKYDTDKYNAIIDKYEPLAKSLGFKRIRLVCEIGVVNGQIKER